MSALQIPTTGYKINSLKLHQGRFIVDVRNNFFMERVVKHGNGQTREMVDSSFLELFKRHGHVALRDIV